MILFASVLEDSWRFGVTILILAFLTVFWYLVVSRITPFPGTSGPVDPDAPDEGEKYPGVRKFTVTADIVLFIWIVVEGAVVIPFMFIKYGMH